MTPLSRRQFLTSAAATSAVMTFGDAAPAFLHSAADQSTESQRILVVVEMAGGNDGLNTVVPFADPAYRDARQKLAIPGTDVLNIADGLGFHPALSGFAELLEAGHLAVVQGVGYSNPNRSHFESMDIWHTCLRSDQNRQDGWLGRFLESGDSASQDPAALHLGSDKQPFALMSRDVRVPSINSLDQFRLNGTESHQFRRAVEALTEVRRDDTNDLLGFVKSSTSSAIAASKRIESAGMKYKPSGEYPRTDLAQKLQTVARLISSGLQTPVYYVRIDGFDTHSNQANAHSSLLRQVGDSVSSFLNDMIAHDSGDRVLVMCFSEFGRRVRENASEGTDHGVAGPMFLAGTQVNAGLIGRHPSLSDLDQGDLKHHIDFRQVYATVLEKWMGCRSDEILHGQFDVIPAIG